MKKWQDVLMAVFFCFLTLSIFNSNLWAKDIVWKLSLPYKPEGVYGEAAKWLAEESKKRSDGRFIIEPYYTNALGLNMTAPLSAIKDRLVELNLTHMSLTAPEEPLAGLPDLPFLFDNEDSWRLWFNNDFVPIFDQLADKKWDVTAWVPFMAPPIQIFSKEPVVSKSDMKGLRIRVYGGPVAALLKQLGCSTYFIGTADIYSALSQGMITSAVTSTVSGVEAHFWEVMSYINEFNISWAPGAIFMSQKAFKKLPEDLQVLVKKLGLDLTAKLVPEVKQFASDSEKLLLSKGMKKNAPSKELLYEAEKLARLLWKEYADKGGPEAVKIMQKAGKYQ